MFDLLFSTKGLFKTITIDFRDIVYAVKGQGYN